MRAHLMESASSHIKMQFEDSALASYNSSQGTEEISLQYGAQFNNIFISSNVQG